MADFIKVTHIVSSTIAPYEFDVEKWISKYFITHLEDDTAHNQSMIIYNGVEMFIREDVNYIIQACQE